MSAFVTEDAKQAFADAVREIESASAIEVVVAVRHHSGSYLHANVLVGSVTGFATLAFLLFSAHEFSLWSILLEPFVAGLAAGALVSWLPALRRWLTPTSGRRRRVRDAARAQFYDKGVRFTRERTGVLLYLSLLERMVEAVPDRGVTTAIPERAWNQAIAHIEVALRTARDGVPVARAVGALAAMCAKHLPASHDDINELADEVHAP